VGWQQSCTQHATESHKSRTGWTQQPLLQQYGAGAAQADCAAQPGSAAQPQPASAKSNACARATSAKPAIAAQAITMRWFIERLLVK
jgi:hypothetical protein